MTETFLIPDTRQQLSRFSPTDAAIAAMAAEYMPLKIVDVNDAAGFQAVHSARMVVKQHRVAVEKVRKDLKADALEYGRKVDGEAKRICGLLAPIETHLEQQENAYNTARDAIRNAARLKAEREAAAAKAAEEARIKAEQEAENERLRIERERLDAERAAMQAEQARIESAQQAERERLDRERQAMEAEQRAVAAEQQRLAQVEADRLRAIENERIRQEAGEQARVETEQRLAREAADAEATRLRAEALRPDHDKLLSIAEQIEQIRVPSVSAEATPFAIRIQSVLLKTTDAICAIVAEMEDTP